MIVHVLMILILRVAALIIAAILIFTSPALSKSRLLIFSAASMKNAMEDIGREFERGCDCSIVFSFAGSGILARQIEAGAPADIFVSANEKWVDWLEEKNSVIAQTRRMIASNRLVIARAQNEKIPDDFVDPSHEASARLLQKGRIAMADPAYVPAGIYGKQALEYLQLWQSISKRLIFSENVRVSLSLVARGDVKSAIVYRSDAHIEPRVKIAYLFATKSHSKIKYPAILVKKTGKSEIMGEIFLKFLSSDRAREIFRQYGFSDEAQLDIKKMR